MSGAHEKGKLRSLPFLTPQPHATVFEAPQPYLAAVVFLAFLALRAALVAFLAFTAAAVGLSEATAEPGAAGVAATALKETAAKAVAKTARKVLIMGGSRKLKSLEGDALRGSGTGMRPARRA